MMEGQRRRGLGESPSTSQLGTIRAKDGWSYQITPEDIIWLARSVECEGGAESSTIWTYAQRLANRHGSSLADLVKAHSQPVNPAWATAGAGRCVQYPDRCTPSQIARRHECATKPWDALSDHALILRWAQAGVANPVPKATDFADATVSQHFLNQHSDAAVILRSGNWYLSEGPSSAPRGGSAAWSPDHVTIEFDGRVAGPALLTGGARVAVPMAGIALVAAGSAFAYWSYSRRKRVTSNRRRPRRSRRLAA